MTWSTVLRKLVSAGLLALLLGGASALPACPQLGVALSPRLMGRTAVAGKALIVTAKVHNRGPTAVRGVGVKITLPPGWNVTASKSKALPSTGLLRKAAAVVGGSTAYWVDVPLSGGKARKFKLRAAIPACHPAAAGLEIDVAAYLTEPGGGATCMTDGQPAQVCGELGRHGWNQDPEALNVQSLTDGAYTGCRAPHERI